MTQISARGRVVALLGGNHTGAVVDGRVFHPDRQHLVDLDARLAVASVRGERPGIGVQGVDASRANMKAEAQTEQFPGLADKPVPLVSENPFEMGESVTLVGSIWLAPGPGNASTVNREKSRSPTEQPAEPSDT